jgi:hypothetical protein
VTIPPYVAEAGPDRWVVKHSSGLRGPLRMLGFRRFPFSSTAEMRPRLPLTFEQMGVLAGELRNLGVAFSYGHDWSPSEVVQQLRDDGLFRGSFVEISWNRTGPELRTL